MDTSKLRPLDLVKIKGDNIFYPVVGTTKDSIYISKEISTKCSCAPSFDAPNKVLGCYCCNIIARDEIVEIQPVDPGDTAIYNGKRTQILGVDRKVGTVIFAEPNSYTYAEYKKSWGGRSDVDGKIADTAKIQYVTLRSSAPNATLKVQRQEQKLFSKKTIGAAGYRIASRQLSKQSKKVLCGLLKSSLSPNAVKSLSSLLDSAYGTALVSHLLFQALKKAPQNEQLLALQEELKIDSLAIMMDATIEQGLNLLNSSKTQKMSIQESETDNGYLEEDYENSKQGNSRSSSFAS